MWSCRIPEQVCEKKKPRRRHIEDSATQPGTCVVTSGTALFAKLLETTLDNKEFENVGLDRARALHEAEDVLQLVVLPVWIVCPNGAETSVVAEILDEAGRKIVRLLGNAITLTCSLRTYS